MGKLNLEDYYLQTKEIGGPITPKDGEKSFDYELKNFLKSVDKQLIQSIDEEESWGWKKTKVTYLVKK